MSQRASGHRLHGLPKQAPVQRLIGEQQDSQRGAGPHRSVALSSPDDSIGAQPGRGENRRFHPDVSAQSHGQPDANPSGVGAKRTGRNDGVGPQRQRRRPQTQRGRQGMLPEHDGIDEDGTAEGDRKPRRHPAVARLEQMQRECADRRSAGRRNQVQAVERKRQEPGQREQRKQGKPLEIQTACGHMQHPAGSKSQIGVHVSARIRHVVGELAVFQPQVLELQEFRAFVRRPKNGRRQDEPSHGQIDSKGKQPQPEGRSPEPPRRRLTARKSHTCARDLPRLSACDATPRLPSATSVNSMPFHGGQDDTIPRRTQIPATRTLFHGAGTAR